MPKRVADIVQKLFHLIPRELFLIVLGIGAFAHSQSQPNIQISNQAAASYQYKSFPADTINTNTILFTVKEAPNFSLTFGSADSNVFGKETLNVRLVYTNIGNQKADTVTVYGMLPPAGLRFVPGSTGGIISGNTVTWKITNIESGRSDSVRVKVVVDSTLLAGTNLQMNGSIDWLSSSVSASKTFVVGSFPLLTISNSPGTSVVGSGRTVTYDILVSNSGNIASSNTAIVDTISLLGSFVSANIPYDSMSADKRIIKWNLGNVAAFSTKRLIVTVVSRPNVGLNTLENNAVVSASNVSQSAAARSTVQILPIIPKSISITSEPNYIFGRQGQDSSLVTAVVKDSLDQLLPDGVFVLFTTTLGSFNNGTKTMIGVIQNGAAQIYVRSEDVQNQVKPFTVTAFGGVSATGTISAAAQLFLYPGAVTGTVMNGANHEPYQGAVASVTNQSKEIVGIDTTKSNGKFFIALNKDVTRYVLEIYVIDKFGDTISTKTSIDPSQFPLPPIVIPNSISGRIVYKISGKPVPAQNVTVFLDSIAGTGPSLSRNAQNKLTGQYGALSRVQEQMTDSRGRFKFENLHPALYIISVDSTQFPKMKGATFVADTTAGAFTFNLSIEIEQDSSITMVMDAPATANAGDTVHYAIRTHNTGNYLHQSVTLTDTLSPFTRFLSAQNGNYSSLIFDSLKHVVQWTRDSLLPAVNDSISFSVLLTRNIPDSTIIKNTVWFNSNQNLTVGQTSFTTVKSAAILNFGNFFAGKDSMVAGDSIQNKIWFTNTGTDSVRNVKIVDTVYFAGESKIRFGKTQFDSVSVADSVIVMYIGAIPPGGSDTLSFSLASDFSLPSGTTIVSSAHLLRNDSIAASASAVVTMMENLNLSSYLKIVKTGNKKTAEIGDIVTYQVQISNTSPALVHTLGVYDLLPHAFRYIKKSARYNGRPIEPTINQNLNSLTWNLPDTILTQRNGLLVYQLAIGADAMESQGLNTAYASAVANSGILLVSAPSQWQVTIRPGVFTEKGLIIGKVFFDDNRNNFQESGENGIKKVELWMEDGTKIITGDDGKYSLPDVKPGDHVLRVDERTLPPGSSLIGGLTSFAKDPVSRFVKVTESGIAKANFFVLRQLKDSIKQSIGMVNKLTAVRQAKPKYIYNDQIRNVKIDTIDMYVSFTFNGSKYLQSIEVNENLPAEVTIVPGSATFNGRNVIPAVYGTSVNWKLGRAKQSMQGSLHYKAALLTFPKKGSVLLSAAVVKVMTADSSYIESKKLISENVVKDVEKNMIETTDIMTTSADPVGESQLGDSVMIGTGDEVFFRITVFIDPKKKVKSIQLLDSLEASFLINERSFSINGIPIPYRNVSVKVRSSAMVSRIPLEKNEIEFLRISSVNLTGLLRGGINEITYKAKLQSGKSGAVYPKSTYAIVKDEFDEESTVHTPEVKIYVRSGEQSPKVTLETSYNDVSRQPAKTDEKIADAVKLVQSLKENGGKAIVMEGITFEYGKTVLTAEAKEILKNVAAILNEDNSLNLRINGYTDNTGNASVNKRTSLARAKEVREYLIGRGVDGKRLSTQGFGPENPIATNKTEAGRAKNRRVEFERIK